MFVIAATIFMVSPVHVLTDSRYSPLISETLLRHGSVALDPWFAAGGTLPYQVETIGGHVYSWYPPGGPVLSAPLVGLLALLGLSAIGPDGAYDEAGDVIVQAIAAALLMAALAALLLATVRMILPPLWSWIVALAAVFGTQIWSTGSRALWGDTFLVLILGAVVWLLVAHEVKQRRLSAPLMATLLAWAYFCRPTAAVAILAVTLHLARHCRRLLIPYAATGAAWAAIFVTWSRLTFGTLLPTYYRTRTFGLRSFGTGLAGILVSPSRGQLVFVPATLFVVYLVLRYRRSLPVSRLVGPAAVAIVGHVVLIAAFPHWHGGHAYGPRYLTPLVPWLTVLAALGARASLDQRARDRRAEWTAGAFLLVVSMFIQARGTWARETWTWNMGPANVSLHPERVWGWRNSQLLAGLVPAPLPPVIARYTLGDRIDVGSSGAEGYLLCGWSGAEGKNGEKISEKSGETFRWTDGRTAELVFELASVPERQPLVLQAKLEGFLPPGRVREQRIELELNGRSLATLNVNRRGPMEVAAAVAPDRTARINRLTLRLPDAAFAARFGLGSDPRQLGVAVSWLRLGPPR